MARIRSIHPGLFTDEAFVSLSADAQIFLLGLWTEADDQGMFEWKPLTLRMRLRPTKDGSVDGLLEEIVTALCIRRFEIGGRSYGAIRNFRKFQRPKKPNAIHPMTTEVGTYVALTTVSTELDEVEADEVIPVDHLSGEKFPQMEDGGGRMKDEGKDGKNSAGASPPPSSESFGFSEFYDAFPLHKARPAAAKAYARALKRTDAETLLNGARRYADQRRGQDKNFTKHPATWLNNDCWLDEEVSRETRDYKSSKPSALDTQLAGIADALVDMGGPDYRPAVSEEPEQESAFDGRDGSGNSHGIEPIEGRATPTDAEGMGGTLRDAGAQLPPGSDVTRPSSPEIPDFLLRSGVRTSPCNSRGLRALQVGTEPGRKAEVFSADMADQSAVRG